MKTPIALVLLLSLSLTGCGEKPRSVQYYRDNPKEIQVVHDRCDEAVKKGSPPDSVLKQNCDNATKAMVDNLRNAIGK